MPACARVLPDACISCDKAANCTQSLPVLISAHSTAIILRPVCPQSSGGDGLQGLHHGPVHVLPVWDVQHVMPGLARPANALQHVCTGTKLTDLFSTRQFALCASSSQSLQCKTFPCNWMLAMKKCKQHIRIAACGEQNALQYFEQ